MDFYYAAGSKAELEAVCDALRVAFDLPAFTFDAHDTWRYAWSNGDHLRLNVTRARDSHTIETWMPSCPRGVNYQVILTAACEPTDFSAQLAAILEAGVTRYDSRSAIDPANGG